jgi:PIN domain nuclease of toxin-antitoxin system
MIYLDTHVLVWLFSGAVDELSPAARDLVHTERLLVSPIVGLELQLLFERGRAKHSAAEVLSALSTEIGLTVCDLPFPLVAARARENSWTRDPFDRLIVAQAHARGATLVTRDQHIRDHYPRALWDTPRAET